MGSSFTPEAHGPELMQQLATLEARVAGFEQRWEELYGVLPTKKPIVRPAPIDAFNKAQAVSGTNDVALTMAHDYTELVAGMDFYFVADGTNNGPMTLKINQLDAVPLRDSDGSELAANAIRAGTQYWAHLSTAGEARLMMTDRGQINQVLAGHTGGDHSVYLSGSDTAYTLTTSLTITDGARLFVDPVVANAPNPTLSINGGVARPIKYRGVGLPTGLFQPGRQYGIRFDASASVWRLDTNAVQFAETVEVTVDLNGGEDFTDIQEAVNYVHSVELGAGSATINIKNGTYILDDYLEFYNLKNRLALSGESRTGVIIRRSDPNERVLNIASPSTVWFENLTLDQGWSRSYRSFVYFDNCTLKSLNSTNTNTTIAAGEKSFLWLRNSSISDVIGTAASVSDSVISLTNCTISGATHHGILGYRSSGPIVGCSFTNIGEVGIYAYLGSSIYVHSTTVSGAQYGFRAYYKSNLSGGSGCSASNCSIATHSPAVGTVGNQNSSVF